MFKKLYILPLLMLLLTSCIYDDPKSEEVCEYKVSFSLALADDATRSEEDLKWGEGYTGDDGFLWDQKISTKPDSIHPVLYDVNDKGELVTTNVAGEIKNLTITPQPNAQNPTSYKISGTLETTRTLGVLQNSRYRLVIFANMKDYDKNNPMSTTAEFTRHGTPTFEEGATDGLYNIPMFGVGEARLSHLGTIDGQTAYEILDPDGNNLSIPMLRAMAKIRVNIAEGIQDQINFYSIHLSRHAKSGYIVPKFWNTVSSVKEIKLGESINAKTGDKCDNEECTKVIQPDENDWRNGDNSLRFFIPDTYNADHDGVQGTDDIKLEVTYYYVGSDPTVAENRITKEIYFQKYENGLPAGTRYDIIRNHIYDFTITEVTPAGGLNIEVDFKPWTYRKIVTEL